MLCRSSSAALGCLWMKFAAIKDGVPLLGKAQIIRQPRPRSQDLALQYPNVYN